jgi:thiamine pyrophosphokinase
MQRFTILLGGDLTVTYRLLSQVAGSRTIAADGGMAHAAALGLSPELWVGDFDSTDAELAAAHADVPRHVFPTAKAASDGALAIREAIVRGATSFVLVGGFGGQFDHVLAHALQLMALAEEGFSVFMTSGHEEAYPLLTSLSLPGLGMGTRLSVLPLMALTGLTITGVRWPLQDHDVPFGSTLTLSNEVDGDVTVLLDNGRALVVVYPQ